MTEPNPPLSVADLARQQFELWNGLGGAAWVEQQRVMDALLAPFLTPLVEAVQESGAQRVLDVGCGAGASTFAAAKRIGASGDALGLDISAPLIDAANTQAKASGAAARFICADAGALALEEDPFDILISRFGVMFFAEPEKAFTNLRNMVKPGGRLCAMTWRSPKENPFMTVAVQAAKPEIDLPRPEPEDPGQFSFADPERVKRILSASGWSGAELTPFDAECVFPLSDIDIFVTKIGPIARPIRELPEDQRADVYARVIEAYQPYIHGDSVHFAAACWRVTATA